MKVVFTLILTICMDSSHCKKVHDGWFISESACHKEGIRHREANHYQCVVTMKELDYD